MTRKEVSQVYYYSREIEKLEREVEKLQDRREQFETAALRSKKLDGMPRAAGGAGSPTELAGIGAAETKKLIDDMLVILRRYKYKLEMKRKEIYEYITTLDDPLIEQIIMYRCIDLCKWSQVAAYVGGDNTEDSVRKAFERHFDK